jgi:phage terminase Nu1 subunit (DNA packaging protein)
VNADVERHRRHERELLANVKAWEQDLQNSETKASSVETETKAHEQRLPCAGCMMALCPRQKHAPFAARRKPRPLQDTVNALEEKAIHRRE